MENAQTMLDARNLCQLFQNCLKKGGRFGWNLHAIWFHLFVIASCLSLSYFDSDKRNKNGSIQIRLGPRAIFSKTSREWIGPLKNLLPF